MHRQAGRYAVVQQHLALPLRNMGICAVEGIHSVSR